MNDGCFSNLRAWANRSLEDDITEVEELQTRLNQDFETRETYTEILTDQVTDEVLERYRDQQGEPVDEL